MSVKTVEKKGADKKKKDTAGNKKQTKKAAVSAVKKDSPQEPSAGEKQNAARKKPIQKLTEKLLALLPELGEDGLKTLIEEAEFYLANARRQEQENNLPAQRGEDDARTATQNETAKELRILRGLNGEVYNFVYCGKWKTFNANELFSLIKIAHQKLPEDEIKSQIYHWMFRERADFIADFSLSDSKDSAWTQLALILKNNFKLSLPL